jgi:hypothetical protein
VMPNFKRCAEYPSESLVRCEVKNAGLAPVESGLPCPSLNSLRVRTWPERVTCAAACKAGRLHRASRRRWGLIFFFM